MLQMLATALAPDKNQDLGHRAVATLAASLGAPRWALEDVGRSHALTVVADIG